MTTKIKTLKDYPVVPMNTEQSKIMIGLLSASSEVKEAQFSAEYAKELGFLGQVFYGRLAAHQVRISTDLAVFLVYLMRTPGESTLWVWTLFNLQKDPGHLLTLSDWIVHFPHGLPSRVAYEAAWDQQKSDHGDNLLDDPATWVRPTV